MTSEAGPTVACAPMRAAGRMTLCGPRVAPASSETTIHAHDSIMEQVRLHDAAAIDRRSIAEAHEVCLRQPVAVAPDATTDRCAEGAQPHGEGRGSGGRLREPGCRDHLDEGVGDLVAPDEARPERMLPHPDAPDDHPLRDGRDGCRDRAGDQHHDAAQQHRDDEAPSTRRATASAKNTPSPMPQVTMTGTMRQSSQSARASRRPGVGS